MESEIGRVQYPGPASSKDADRRSICAQLERRRHDSRLLLLVMIEPDIHASKVDTLTVHSLATGTMLRAFEAGAKMHAGEPHRIGTEQMRTAVDSVQPQARDAGPMSTPASPTGDLVTSECQEGREDASVRRCRRGELRRR